MSTKIAYAMLAIVALAGGLGAVTTMTFQTAVADQGGVPDDSARSGPACDNAAERHDRFLFRDGINRGSSQSHTSTFHNDRGLEHSFGGGC